MLWCGDVVLLAAVLHCRRSGGCWALQCGCVVKLATIIVKVVVGRYSDYCP